MTAEKRTELDAWIALLECEPSSWANYQKLATLYTIRDSQGTTTQHMALEAPVLYSRAAAPAVQEVGHYGNSDFLLSVEGKDPEKIWRIIDELMDTLHVVNERVYHSVMRKIEAV